MNEVSDAPGLVDVRFLLDVGERALRRIREHVWALSGVSAVVGVFLYARSLRYYDSAFRELGVPGLPVQADEAQASVRALVGTLILVTLVLAAFFAFTTARASFRYRVHRATPLVFFVVVPAVIGFSLTLGPGGVSIGVALLAGSVFGMVGFLSGAVAGGRELRRDQRASRRSANEERSGEKPLPLEVSRPLSFGYLPLAVGMSMIMLWAGIDRDARSDVNALWAGGAQDDVTMLLAPLDARRVVVEWKEPSAGNRRPLPSQPLILVSRADGRVILVDRNRRLLDLPAGDVVMRSPDE